MAAMKIMTKATYGKKFLQFPRGKSPSLSRQEGGRAGRNSAWGSELRTQLLNSKQKANANWPKKKLSELLKTHPQWHMSASEAKPPKTPKSEPPTGDRAFKWPRLTGDIDHSDRHM